MVNFPTLRNSLQQSWRHRAERIVAPFARFGITPNGLTILGFVLNVIAAVIVAFGAFVPGGIAVLIAGAFDLFDGALARVTNRKTVFGAFFDSTMDRFSEAVVFFGLQVAFLLRPGLGFYAEAGAVLTFLALIGSLMISYTRARAEGLGLNCEVGLLQRPERVIVLGVGLLLPLPLLLAVLAALAILTHITVAQRIAHVRHLTGGR